MEITTTEIWVGIQVYAVLLALCGYLIYRFNSEKRRTQSLHDKLAEFKEALKNQRQRTKEAENKYNDAELYKIAIENQLEQTRRHYDSLPEKGEISLDLSTRAPAACQTAALRNALLVAERESAANNRHGKPDWEILQTRFTSIIKFYETEINELLQQQSNPSQEEETPESTTSETESNTPINKTINEDNFSGIDSDLLDDLDAL